MIELFAVEAFPATICFIMSILGVVLILTFRERPSLIRRAIDSGESADVLERQRLLLRRMRKYGWWLVVVGGVAGVYFVRAN
jgi:hypothetical protein